MQRDLLLAEQSGTSECAEKVGAVREKSERGGD
jgi:hypothetical protein